VTERDAEAGATPPPDQTEPAAGTDDETGTVVSPKGTQT
jgi:hypothetical protein